VIVELAAESIRKASVPAHLGSCSSILALCKTRPHMLGSDWPTSTSVMPALFAFSMTPLPGDNLPVAIDDDGASRSSLFQALLYSSRCKGDATTAIVLVKR